jgi:gamma-glutamyl-gamma-aminobutyrate hydrolase PuuD
MGLKLVANALSADGLIEGFEKDDGRVVCVQCHPEDLTDHEWSRELFGWLVRTAGEAASARR